MSCFDDISCFGHIKGVKDDETQRPGKIHLLFQMSTKTCKSGGTDSATDICVKSKLFTKD